MFDLAAVTVAAVAMAKPIQAAALTPLYDFASTPMGEITAVLALSLGAASVAARILWPESRY